jgi:sirohydrochlorin ferrochelatase
MLHADAVPAERLEGRPAEVFKSALELRARQGQTDFLVVPLFFGPSEALTDYLPRCVSTLQARFPRLRVRRAPCLVDVNAESDESMATILEDRVRACMAGRTGQPAVVLVDHGSPMRAVATVRNHLAAQLAARLGRAVSGVRAASMERRPGSEYDFNEPLLERVLDEPGWGTGPVIVAMQFLLPGRHAGPGGDVARICATAQRRGLQVVMTELVGSHPGLIPLLADRARQGMASAPLPG